MKGHNSNERRVRRCARPIDIQKRRDRVVLCIHGFSGYPGEMAYPASRLDAAGWDVRVPRLGGHGTDGKDFFRTRLENLARQVQDEWLNLKASYGQVLVLGHSMGALMALELARLYPVERLAVMAPAIGIRAPGLFLVGPVSFFVPRRPMEWKSDNRYKFFDDRDPDDEEWLGKEYWSWSWLRHLAQLRRIMKRNERQLDRIKSPVLGVFGGKDTTVGPLGYPILEKGLGGKFEALVLEEGGHYLPYDYHPGVKEAAMDAVIEWFERGPNQE